MKKLLAGISVAEMEAETLRRAIQRTDEEIVRVLVVLDAMRAKQVCRQHEMAKILKRIADGTAKDASRARKTQKARAA